MPRPSGRASETNGKSSRARRGASPAGPFTSRVSDYLHLMGSALPSRHAQERVRGSKGVEERLFGTDEWGPHLIGRSDGIVFEQLSVRENVERGDRGANLHGPFEAPAAAEIGCHGNPVARTCSV
jgi:hypothetical protein